MDASTSWSRRGLLVVSASAAGAALLAGPLGSAASAATAPGTTAANRATTGLRREHWTPLVGKKVVVDTAAGRVKATVVDVEDIAGAPPEDPGRFSVELRAPGAKAVSGLCPVTIPGRGVATLLVSAVDRGVRHRSSQIIVNNPTT